MTYENLRLGEQLCFALYAASNAVIRAYRARLRELNVTYPQYITLLALWDRGPSSVKALARTLQLDSAALTPLLKRMEAKGWVRRERSKEDERQVIVTMTPRGDALRPKLAKIQSAVACDARSSIGDYGDLRSRLQHLANDLYSDD